MTRGSKIVMALVVVALVSSGLAMAQASTYEVKKGTVVHVYGDNLVVKMSDGTIREVDVQEGFMFDVDGTPTPVSKLKPGTVLTANIKTTQETRVVQTEKIEKGKVVRRVGQTVIIRKADGEIKKFHEVPEDIVLTSNGEPVTLWDLKEGMNVTATIISKREEIVTDRQVQVAGSAPAAAPKPAPAPAPAPKPYTPPPALPSTGSQLPLMGLAGMVFIIIGLGIGIIRRF